LVQGYDFYYLWENQNVKLQMGGSDQWGNIVTGTELIRKKGNGEAFALTTPLIKKADGTKFGKTEGGNIWLDPKRTTPYQFFQFWINASDADVKNYIRIFTLFNKEEVEAIEIKHDAAPHERHLQKALAKDITIRVHGESAYNTALIASDILFGKGTSEQVKSFDEATFLSVFEGVPTFEVMDTLDFKSCNLIDLLTEKTAIFASKSEARKMILAGGFSMNQQKIETADTYLNAAYVLNGKYLLAQKGKKNYFIIKLNTYID
jgi:tyrosyl-tRNA synthetase